MARFSAQLSIAGAAFLAVGFALAATAAMADPVADFYGGKQIKLLITTQAGSGYDLEGRLVGRHIGRLIPGQPTIVPQNVPGAGGIRIANSLYTTATEDGTTLAMLQNTTALMQATGVEGVQYDASKFYWIGSVSPSVDTMSVWHTAGIKTIDDAKRIEVPAAAGGAATLPSFPRQ
jgi:tripartite-type tricarboxylate transporter receptor subunit TctC